MTRETQYSSDAAVVNVYITSIVSCSYLMLVGLRLLALEPDGFILANKLSAEIRRAEFFLCQGRIIGYN